jgi:hypothetical protein
LPILRFRSLILGSRRDDLPYQDNEPKLIEGGSRPWNEPNLSR